MPLHLHLPVLSSFRSLYRVSVILLRVYPPLWFPLLLGQCGSLLLLLRELRPSLT